MYTFRRYKIFITAGCLLWAGSFFAEAANYQPCSTAGVIVSPLLLTVGLVMLLMSRYRRRVQFRRLAAAQPRDFSVAPPRVERNPNIIITILLGFWTTCIIVWVLVVFVSGFAFKHSGAFVAIADYCSNIPAIQAQTGGIRYYGMLIGGDIQTNYDSGTAQLSFTIIGKKAIVPATARVVKANGRWKVAGLEIR